MLIYSSWFCIILFLYNLASLLRPTPLDPHKRNQSTDPGKLSLAQGEAISFPVFYQINSHVSLSGATFFVPLRASTRLLTPQKTIVIFNASTTPEPEAQAWQNLKTHRIRRDTRFWL